ncbi:hypothetical protein RCL1_005421 [Eukaryota sp. TZLM3-RCL]
MSSVPSLVAGCEVLPSPMVTGSLLSFVNQASFKEGCIMDYVTEKRLTLPRACLLKGLYLLLEKAMQKVEGFGFSHALHLALHFGNISNHFRDLVHSSMTILFEGRTIVEEHFRSPFLKRFLTRGFVSVDYYHSTSAIYEFQSPDFNVDLHHKIAIELGLNKPTTSLSSIDELVGRDYLHLHVSTVLGDSFHFPSQFSSLRSLKVSGSYSNVWDSFSLNIEELTSLTCFEYKVGGRVQVITGLSRLVHLKSIMFSCVTKCDGLHPLVKLKQAKFHYLEQPCLEVLFRNPDNYQHCWIALHSLELHSSFQWVKSCFISKFALRCLPSDGSNNALFSTKEMPFIKEASVFADSDVVTVVELASDSYLERLYFEMEDNSTVTLKFEPILYLESLRLLANNPDVVAKFLECCLYLKQLSFSETTFSSDLSISSSQLQCLESLTIYDVSGFFDKLPCLPKLKYLKVANICFDFDTLGSMFPVLRFLSMYKCDLRGSSHPNRCLKYLTFDQCTVMDGCFDVLSEFSLLVLLKVICYDTATNFDLQVPNSLLNLSCRGCFPFMCNFLDNVSSTCFVSVQLIVPSNSNGDVTMLQSWLSNYQCNRPNTCFIAQN